MGKLIVFGFCSSTDSSLFHFPAKLDHLSKVCSFHFVQFFLFCSQPLRAFHEVLYDVRRFCLSFWSRNTLFRSVHYSLACPMVQDHFVPIFVYGFTAAQSGVLLLPSRVLDSDSSTASQLNPFCKEYVAVNWVSIFWLPAFCIVHSYLYDAILKRFHAYAPYAILFTWSELANAFLT